MPVTGNNPTHKNLSIRFSTDGFSFCANGNRKSVPFTKPDTWFRRCMAIALCEPALWEQYDTVNIDIDDNPYALVPSAMFNENECTSIIKFNHPGISLRHYTIHTDNMDGFDITNIYTINTELYNFIQTNFPYATISHISTSLIAEALMHSKKNNTTQAWCIPSEKHMITVVADCGNLLLTNRFSLLNDTDAAYYIGAIFNQYNLSQTETYLYVKGENPSIIEKLKKYVSNTITVE